ncbi:NACHT, LRR and PYD domains-containing protein 12-like isoform X2 [Mugil cephalus]|uniref:NACHT, LRR and PYD domains-containing protein 12-like isoform X2 n=1 Tax=Mugil cephalus TaxID=48193 RepID=UPI001FB854E9|nr:NACHT, LRR and PYD domains-containing protein 12-like isoform X2 [Mugil cephalus]
MDSCGKKTEGNKQKHPCGKDEKETKAESPEEQQQRADSPVASNVSMTSDRSMSLFVDFKTGHTDDGTPGIKSPEPQHQRQDSLTPSCASNNSLFRLDNFKTGQSDDGTPEIRRQEPQHQRPDSPTPSCASNNSLFRSDDFKTGQSDDGTPEIKRHELQISGVPNAPSTQQDQKDLKNTFMLVEQNIACFVKNELKNFMRILGADYPECLENQTDDEALMGSEMEEQKKSCREAFIKITQYFLRAMKEEKLADSLHNRTQGAVCQRKLKSNLKKRFQCVFEGVAKAGNPTLLNQIYTELYITEGESKEVSDQHEVRQIEAASGKEASSKSIFSYEDLFKPLPGRDKPVRTVMTKGVAGIGKSVLTQKFTLDWAEDKTNKDTLFIFPFTFRELNLMKEKRFSLMKLVHHFFNETKETGICTFEEFKILFIFDGLDECRPPLDFHKTEILTDVTESTSVDVLLTNLIRGKLLPSAHLWITTRRAAANQIPPEYVDKVTEVTGFTDPQKEEYFRKRFRDEEQASRIISHIKTSQNLHTMCHIPVFCWITAEVLDHTLKTKDKAKLPKTLTEMYIYFLVVQTKLSNEKYHKEAETYWNKKSRKMVLSLGKLAFEHLQKGKLIFYESDLTECGIDIRAASVYSGVLTQIFKEERGVYWKKVFCFVHLSVQEFLAALYVHLTFAKSGKNLLSGQSCRKNDFYKSAVDKALQSQNGHLDLFLRFLLGLSLQTNQTLLPGLLTQTGSLEVQKETAEYIKNIISTSSDLEKCISLFHCLSELRDCSLVEEIQHSLSSGSPCSDKLSSDQWSALVYILLSSENDLKVFDLKKYSTSEKAFLKLLPVIKACSKVQLSGCKLSSRSCETLASVLRDKSRVSSVKELDLSDNDLQDTGVEHLCDILRDPTSTLQKLRLTNCKISWRCCEALASVLSSESSGVKDLDLSNNELQDVGMMSFCAGLKSPKCRLEVLRLSNCNLSKGSCETLASVLRTKSTHVKELDLSNNDLQDEGVTLLCDGLKSPNCTLEKLRLTSCTLSWKNCKALSAVLSFQFFSLKELDLSNNDLPDAGVKFLCAGLESPNCTLEKLSLLSCNLSGRSCEALALVLRSKSSSVKELDLSNNDLHDVRGKLLCAGLESPNCTLEKLRLSSCKLSLESCDAIAKVLSSQFSSVKELDLSDNVLPDTGVKLLCAGLKSPNCRLEKLRLTSCNLSERSCEGLAPVLRSVKELYLCNNDLQDAGVKLLCTGLKNRKITLETLRMSGCLITNDGCTSLASALSHNRSHIRELDLSYNNPGDSGKMQLSAGLSNQQWKLDTLRMDNCGVQRLKPGLKKYACELNLDPDTAHRYVKLTDNNRRAIRRDCQQHPDHEDRFDFWPQVLCTEALTGRAYWEVECRGDVHVAVTYRGIRRRGEGNACKLGGNHQSWSLSCSDDFYSVYHNDRETKVPFCSYSPSHRIAVYLDCPAGTLSFYRVSGDALTPLHTFYCTFTEPLYPAFGLGFRCSSTSGNKLLSGTFVSLCTSTESTETKASEGD